VIASLAALALLAPAAFGADPGEIHRQDVIIRAPFTATVVAHDVFRLRSTIDGRVEDSRASTGTWHAHEEALATLSSTELAAMIDARGNQDQGVLEDRWQQIYRPTKIQCPDECFVLKSFVRPKAWVKPQAVLYEAAAGLKIVARVGRKFARRLAAGQTMTVWRVSAPERKYATRVERVILDAPADKGGGASVEVELSPQHWLPPGTPLEGDIIVAVHRDMLVAPTVSLMRSGRAAYLVLRVNLGETQDDITEIVGGAAERQGLLTLEDAERVGIAHYQDGDAVDPDPNALQAPAPVPPAAAPRAAGTAPAAAPGAAQFPSAPPTRAPAQAPEPARAPSDGKDFGDDPYGR
jgi:hypothetical protein